MNSVCSSAPAAAAAASGAAAATATGAAAETPHFSSSILESSAASRTVSWRARRPVCCRSAMFLIISLGLNFVAGTARLTDPALSRRSRPSWRRRRTPAPAGRRAPAARRRCAVAGVWIRPSSLRPQLVERGQLGQRLHAIGVEQSARRARRRGSTSLSLRLGELDRDLRRRHRVLRVGDRRRALEQRRRARRTWCLRGRARASRFFATL